MTSDLLCAYCDLAVLESTEFITISKFVYYDENKMSRRLKKKKKKSLFCILVFSYSVFIVNKVTYMYGRSIKISLFFLLMLGT